VRTAFIDTLCEVAADDERVWLVCGDLGYSVLERFATRFPGRFLNAGVAEQNMIGVAAGLALTGKVVFVYSIVNFPVMRCLEQVRNDVCYHRLSVKVVAVGGGLVYGGHGYSHHGAEDLAVMRAMPHMTVVAPGDPVETRLAVRAISSHGGPCYLRLGRGGEPAVHATPPAFALGRAIRLREGTGLSIAATGGALPLAMTAADQLCREGHSVAVLSVPTLAPFDAGAVVGAARSAGRLVTVEEHGWGGLGTAAAEAIAAAGLAIRFHAVRLGREPVESAGSHDYLRGRHGVSVEGVLRAAREALGP
jgi:transketolase